MAAGLRYSDERRWRTGGRTSAALVAVENHISVCFTADENKPGCRNIRACSGELELMTTSAEEQGSA